MTRIQRQILKNRVKKNLHFSKKELRHFEIIGSRYHLRQDRLFKAAASNLRREVRLFRRLNAKL